MKRVAVHVIVPLLTLGMCFGRAEGRKGRSTASVVVTNPSAFVRPSETVSLPWADVSRRLAAPTPFHVGVLLDGNEIPSQVIDADGDGTPEELIFQWSPGPHEKGHFTLKTFDSSTVFPQRVDARFAPPREDIAWENDRIAFRLYGPALAAEVNNGFDVWVKRVRHLIVEKWYRANEGRTSGKDTYHEDHGEGADFFAVGNTLGAGSCGILHNGTLIQPGVFSKYKIFARGPIRAGFTVTYENGKIDGHPYREVKTVTLDAGHNLNRVDVTYSGIGRGTPITVLAGIVKRSGTVTTANGDGGWVSLWGPTNGDPVNEFLGTAVLMPRAAFGAFREDSVHAAITGKTRDGKSFTYYTGAGWTRSGDIADNSAWRHLLDAWALRLREPVSVSWPK